MKHPGLQHEARLLEALARFNHAKNAYLAAKRADKEAQREKERTYKVYAASSQEHWMLREDLVRLLDCEEFNEDGLPIPTPSPLGVFPSPFPSQ